MMAEYTRVSHL